MNAKLSGFEIDMLAGAIRYYVGRLTASGYTFPQAVAMNFNSKMSREDKRLIRDVVVKAIRSSVVFDSDVIDVVIDCSASDVIIDRVLKYIVERNTDLMRHVRFSVSQKSVVEMPATSGKYSDTFESLAKLWDGIRGFYELYKYLSDDNDEYIHSYATYAGMVYKVKIKKSDYENGKYKYEYE